MWATRHQKRPCDDQQIYPQFNIAIEHGPFIVDLNYQNLPINNGDFTINITRFKITIDLPINNGDFPYVSHYQRVDIG